MKNIYKIIGIVFSELPCVSLLAINSKAKRDEITALTKPGDIIISNDWSFPIWSFIIRTITGSQYSHAALVVSETEVVEASYSGFGKGSVFRSTIEKHLRGYKSAIVIRPPYSSRQQLQRGVSFAVEQIGKPYNFSMRPSDGSSYFCTELVGEALANSGIHIDSIRCWVGEGILPDAFITMPGVRIVYNPPCQKQSLFSFFFKPFVFPLTFALSAFYFFQTPLSKALLFAFLVSIIVGGLQYLLIQDPVYSFFKSKASQLPEREFREKNIRKNTHIHHVRSIVEFWL